MKKITLPRWLRRLLLVLLTIVAVPVLLWLVAVIYNRFDDPLSPQVQAWLSYPVPRAEPAQNGFLLELALTSSRPDGQVAAQQFLDAAHKAPGTFYDDPGSLDALYQRLMRQGPALVTPYQSCRYACMVAMLQDRAQLVRSLQTYAPNLARYDHMLDQPAYAEDMVLARHNLYDPYFSLMHVDALFRGRILEELESGEAERAYTDWGRRQQFFQRAAAGSATLINLMIVLRGQIDGEELLAYMLQRHPETVPLARRLALPVLNAYAPVGLRAQFASSMAREFSLAASYFQSLQFSNWWPNRHKPGYDMMGYPPVTKGLGLLLMKYNATLNLMQALRESNMAANGLRLDGKPLRLLDDPCHKTWRFVVSLDNPVGKTLACIGDLDFGNYVRRIDSFVQMNAQVRATLASHDDVAAYVKLNQKLTELDQ